MGLKVKKGDNVAIIAGKDVGVQGRVLQVLPERGKVLVEGVNRQTRHEKVRPAQGRAGQVGGISHKEGPIDISNVAIVCPTDGPTRVGYKIEADGTKTRVCKKCGTEL